MHLAHVWTALEQLPRDAWLESSQIDLVAASIHDTEKTAHLELVIGTGEER
jgi:hypothetical protein